MILNDNSRKAAVTPMFAFGMVALMGFVAIAVDGGLLFDRKQWVQAAADAAALAAAADLYAKYNTNQGADTGGTARQAALDNASVNGISNASVTVNIPPLTGPFANKAGFAEVIINYNQRRYFSRLFGSADHLVYARAVAQGLSGSFKNGVLVLHPNAPGALTTVGNGKVTVTGVPFIINSSAADAGTTTGNSIATSDGFFIGGTPGTSGSGTWIGPIKNGQQPTPDPLAYLPEPNPDSMVLRSNNPTHYSGNGNNTKYVQPGVYRGGISVTGQVSLNMAPGIYYMDGGGFDFSGQGSLQAEGVMIVNAPNSNSQKISINGSGDIKLSGPTSGIYQGISLWQARSSTNVIDITGNGGSQLKGTFYTAKGTLNVTGNGVQDILGSQYISNLLTVNGNGEFSVNWEANKTAQRRIFGLVE